MTAIARPVPETRDGSRRNMFLGASLRRGPDQVAVRIRNMSALGALVDSPLVPDPNSAVELVRGLYVARGRVVWSEQRRCGIRFTAEVSVNDWLAPLEGQRTPPPQPAHALPAAPEPPEIAARPPQQERPACVDLNEVARLVGRVARILAADPVFLRLHMSEGRDLVRAAQMLAGLCDADPDESPSSD